MSDLSQSKPAANEYAPYYEKYIGLVPDGGIVDNLRQSMAATLALFSGLTEEKALHRYAPEKWSIKEVLGHILDGERIFAYRALRIARNDTTPLPGFDQDEFVKYGAFDERPLGNLLEEYLHVRESTIDLFASFTEEAWNRRGISNQLEVSVRAIAWVLCGHELHHMEVIRTRYL